MSDSADVRSTRQSTIGPGPRARLWLLPLAACAGVAASVIVAIGLKPAQPQTVADLRAEFAQLLLRRSTNPNASDGGPIGPWWVAAADGNASTGEFRDFQLTSGSVQLAARKARLIIDPEGRSFRFDLEDVVLISVSSETTEDEGGDVVHMDRYTLGPVPLIAKADAPSAL